MSIGHPFAFISLGMISSGYAPIIKPSENLMFYIGREARSASFVEHLSITSKLCPKCSL